MKIGIGLFLDHTIGAELFLLINQNVNYEIRFVVVTKNFSDCNIEVRRICLEQGISYLIYENSTSDLILEKTDLVLLISWKYIMSEEHIKYFGEKVFNLHYSLLPRHRGSYPVNQSILKGDRVSGFTIHKIDGNIDSGPIFYQHEVKIEICDNAETLLRKIDASVLTKASDFLDLISKNVCFYSQKKGRKKPAKKLEILKLREISLKKRSKNIDFLNLLRSLTFPSMNSYPYVIDPDSGKKIAIKLVLEEFDD